MRTTWTLLLLCALTASPLLAGVVYEIEVKDHDASPPRTETNEMSAEGKNLKMEIDSDGRGSKGEMIFRGDRREMVIVDHDEKSYMVIDEAAMREMASQVSAAMKQMEEALKNVPEGQRKMVEEMMKKSLPQAVATERPVAEVRETGERGTHAGYPCVKYEMLLNGTKTSELWVTDWSNIEGGEEAADAFKAMGEFFREMMDTLATASGPMGGFFSNIGNNAFEHLRELDGFPVLTREFDGGEVESESTLLSSNRRTLDPADFEPPAGYKRREMFRQ